MKRGSKRKGKTRESPSAGDPGRRKHRGRIYREIRSNGASLWTLFDSGSRRTYVSGDAAGQFGVRRLPEPIERGLGGKTHKITHFCALSGKVEGYGITADALVVPRLFPDERGRPIDVILGIETMESWGINLDTTRKRLDFRFYAREAIEG